MTDEELSQLETLPDQLRSIPDLHVYLAIGGGVLSRVIGAIHRLCAEVRQLRAELHNERVLRQQYQSRIEELEEELSWHSTRVATGKEGSIDADRT